MGAIASNIQKVQERIASAAAACGRATDDITLLPISKTFPVETICEAISAGLRQFGENRVQEAEAKIRFLRDHGDVRWHLVGHLQSNKARRAAELFHVIHSVDSVKLATKLSQASQDLAKSLSVLLQVDLGLEITKFGVARDQTRGLVSEISRLPGLQLNGLMTLPPFYEDPSQTRPFFRELKELRDDLESEQPGCLGQGHLSMGMSHDFEIAIQEGSTIVRLGTAIFGSRAETGIDD